MSDDQVQDHGQSVPASRLSCYSGRYYDFMDTHHSVFSRNAYYDDMTTVHPWLRRPCSPDSGIPLSTLRTRSCSPRLHSLSKPRIKRDHLIKQEVFDNITNYAYSGVKPAALTPRHSDRLFVLAQPKKAPNGYKKEYILPRLVPKQALHIEATKRICALAEPRTNIKLIHTAWKNQRK